MVKANSVKNIVNVLKESGIDEKYIAMGLIAGTLVPITLEYAKSIIHDVLEHDGTLHVEVGKLKLTAGKRQVTADQQN